ncbi:MAG TPA: c-type cytochrome [Gammaproteobacteria bacterium]|nr:c-type cytochrome [Gammaproteobacteria bacterium]
MANQPSSSAPSRRKTLLIAAAIVVAVVVVFGVLYVRALPGLSVARNEPPALETTVATWLLSHSVPGEDRAKQNPLGADAAAVAAGRDSFRQKCETCHAYDGGGRTEIGAGSYPRPPDLEAVLPSLTDGEIFYHIRNGIRNTAMPAWNLPDREIWELVSYIRRLPDVASLAAADNAAAGDVSGSRYVGSQACKSCHEDQFARWTKTKMANVVRNPKEHPDAVLPDFSKPDPLLTFTLDDVAFVYGSGWKQRYFKKVGNDYFPLPAQWDVTHKIWRPYHVGDNTDWWAKLYPDPGDNSQRPTGPLCDGCHSVDFHIEDNSVAEWNVGCERCHGAGSAHVDRPTRANIVNPGRMDYVHANDTCIQCHSQGQPLANPINGKYYDWPVGYDVGKDLSSFWKLEEHKLGETTFTHFPDGTAHKNRMQGNDFVQSLMYERGVTCFSCHDPHGTDNEAMLREPVENICGACHGPNSQNGPHAATIEAHTHHKADSPGSQCVACHMPKIEQTMADINVSSHTFHFVTPSETDSLKIPNACNVCHKDEGTAWATAALASWRDRSIWRMTK